MLWNFILQVYFYVITSSIHKTQTLKLIFTLFSLFTGDTVLEMLFVAVNGKFTEYKVKKKQYLKKKPNSLIYCSVNREFRVGSPVKKIFKYDVSYICRFQFY